MSACGGLTISGTYPCMAVAQALSRLKRDGTLERLSKGVYYRARNTAFGKSKPNPAAMQRLAFENRPVFPAGIAAANLLGFTTQTAKRAEIATSELSLPRKLVGSDQHPHPPPTSMGRSGQRGCGAARLHAAGRRHQRTRSGRHGAHVARLTVPARTLWSIAQSRRHGTSPRARHVGRNRRTAWCERSAASAPPGLAQSIPAFRFRVAIGTFARQAMASQGVPIQ